MAIYHNLLCWQPLPDLQAGDVVESGNLAGRQDIPDIPLTFIGVNLRGCKLTDNHTRINCAEGELIEFTEPENVVKPELSAKATIVYNALKGSGQLDANKLTALEQLTNMVDGIAGTKVGLGAATTDVVMSLMNDLLAIGKEQEAQMIQQMLQAVQAEWSDA